jgi:hypothetical protein
LGIVGTSDRTATLRPIDSRTTLRAAFDGSRIR